MKFIIKKKVIEHQIDRMQTAILTYNNSPLSSFFIKLTRGGLFIISTNSELSYNAFIKKENLIEIQDVGFCLIDGFFLRDVVKKSDSELNFELKGTELIVFWENAIFSKTIRDPSFFPEIDFEQKGVKLIVNAKNFKKAIKNTAFATTNNPSQPILSAINIKAEDGFLYFSATDTTRFASERVQISNKTRINISVSAKNLKDFIPPELDSDIQLNIEPTKISYIYDDLTIQSRIFTIDYKDISNILPKKSEILYSFSIQKREILDLIDKTTIITPGKDNVINLSMSKDTLKGYISQHESGQSNVSTNNVLSFKINSMFANDSRFDPDFVEVNINYRYLKDAISVFDKIIEIHINEKMTKMLVVSPERPEIYQLIGLVLI
ncbi:DNA polymerase III subunit beta [Mycoplasma flocculare]|uniref:DNA polymerase III subunit beta n=2 Tax=Mesomycoplasma flocculare TaxID=2128 RepID=A0A0A8E6N0_MESFC|nr:DNA polymerase III subunit beta [Mesomycoplasma flocculare]AJC49584.1 DNA polymerase III subunit beta [Mesomycoplasma flocculare ATCC 27399]ENX51259.1 DNA polymerase III beta subunit [Mesomycoplasma flocculare ATCC 27716]MXR13706.1 DNA polymerase III subunit beta [Mesomycoplasma flocculare]MXR23054.1 DNA polymerase III subunit beta [Mesomycoplasma flocculare]MXR55997.1 DNA polymerase III subunit beta [Mesomycoplasma flocculare]